MIDGAAGPDWLLALAGLALGAAVAGVYLGALWWTVRRLPGARHAGLLLLGSGVIRVGVVVGTLLFVLSWGWSALIAALLSFTAVRWVVAHRVGPAPGDRGR